MVTAGIVAAVVLSATAGSWVVAARARTPAGRAQLVAPPPPSVVTAEISGERLVEELVLDGALERTVTVTVAGPAAVAGGASRVVVTGLPLMAGDSVPVGTVLAEVSGRPLIALPGEFPSYRDLTRGDAGTDVRQLQAALGPIYGTPVTGTFDARTEADVRRLYASAGYPPITRGPEPAPPEPGDADLASPPPTPGPARRPPPVVVPAGELVFLQPMPAVVGEVLSDVGADGTEPLLTLVGGGWQVVVPVDEAAESTLAALPDGATLALADGPLAGRDVEPPTFRSSGGDEPEAQSREAVFGAADAPTDVRVGDAQVVRVVLARSPDGAAVVPVSALWTRADGSVVVTVVAPDGSAHDVAVTVALTMGGRAAVLPLDAELPEGGRVVVGYRDGAAAAVWPDG